MTFGNLKQLCKHKYIKTCYDQYNINNFDITRQKIFFITEYGNKNRVNKLSTDLNIYKKKLKKPVIMGHELKKTAISLFDICKK